MASIRRRTGKDGSGGWQVRYMTPDGKSRARTFRLATEARRFASTVEADLVRGEWSDPRLGQVTFGAFSENWSSANLPRLKPSTRLGYESLLRTHLLPAFGPVALSGMRRQDVELFITQKLSEDLSPSRTGQCLRLLKLLMNSAVDNGYIVKSPAAGIKAPRSAKKEVRFLSAPEVSRVVEQVPVQDQTLVLTLAYCGLRWGEAVALRRARVNLLRRRLEIRESASEVGGRLHFGATKTYQHRSVPLPSFLVDALARHLETGGAAAALVFTSAKGRPLRGNNFRKRIWHPALERAGLPPIRIHDLRHTCAALLISQGHSPKSIQQHLGHSSIVVTMDVYGGLFPDEQENISASLDELWRGAQ